MATIYPFFPSEQDPPVEPPGNLHGRLMAKHLAYRLREESALMARGEQSLEAWQRNCQELWGLADQFGVHALVDLLLMGLGEPEARKC